MNSNAAADWWQANYGRVEASKNRTRRDFERALDALGNGMNGRLLRGFGSYSAMPYSVVQ